MILKNFYCDTTKILFLQLDLTFEYLVKKIMHPKIGMHMKITSDIFS